MKIQKKIKFIIILLVINIVALCAVTLQRLYYENKRVEQFSTVENYQEENLKAYSELYKIYPEADKELVVQFVNGKLDEKLIERMQEVISSPEYDETHFIDYYDYIEVNPDASNENLIYLINEGYKDFDYNMVAKLKELKKDEAFLEENLERYLSLKESMTAEEAIRYVNYNLDLVNTGLSAEELNAYLNDKYYINKNLKRYIDYHNKNKSLSVSEVVKRVNVNLDSSFYDNVVASDTSKGVLSICNKHFYLKSNYAPDNLISLPENYSAFRVQLQKEAAEKFMEMCDAAKKENHKIIVDDKNGYRSYAYQKATYDYYVEAYGTNAAADKYAARPGYSEHQLGLSVVVLMDGNKLNDTGAFKWLLDNCYKYGFINRYPNGLDYITGFSSNQQMHFRYVGVEAAAYIHENKISFEEYYAYFVQDNDISQEDFIKLFN